MGAPWPLVKLGEVLTHRKEFVMIDDLAEYKRCRVQLHAQGIVLRDQLPGAEIKTKKQQVCRAGDFLVAEIDAKVGGYGIVPAELDGAIVSSHYFLFKIHEDRLDLRFLGYFLCTPAFSEQVAAQGSTNYAAIRPSHVLDYTIPLPPLAEQRRIVARLDALAAKIEEARRLRNAVDNELERLCRSILVDETFGKSIPTPLSKLVFKRDCDISVLPMELYHFAGVYSFGRGVFSGVRKLGSEFAYKQLTRLHQGNFVYPKLMAWEGAFGVVPAECDGLVVSPEFPVFELNTDVVLPETLDTYFRNPSIWEKVSGSSTGTNARRRRLNPRSFLEYQFPLPSMKTQLLLRSLRQQTVEIRQQQTASAAELDALLPSLLDQAFRGEL